MSERGVKETKEVLAFVFSMTNAIKVSLADGDFDFWDAKNFVEPLKKIAPAVENIEEVLPELEDLSLDEVIELTKYSMTELGLGGNIDVESEVNDAVKKVEDAIDMGKKMLSLVKSIGYTYMRHESLDKLMALGMAAVVGIVGWALYNIVELKEDMASVKSDVKHISKTVDEISKVVAVRAIDDFEKVVKN